jgi:hypothetical protein
LRGGLFECGPICHSAVDGALTRRDDQRFVEVVPGESELGYAWAMITVDAPWPQPTSTECSPPSS